MQIFKQNVRSKFTKFDKTLGQKITFGLMRNVYSRTPVKWRLPVPISGCRIKLWLSHKHELGAHILLDRAHKIEKVAHKHRINAHNPLSFAHIFYLFAISLKKLLLNKLSLLINHTQMLITQSNLPGSFYSLLPPTIYL